MRRGGGGAGARFGDGPGKLRTDGGCGRGGLTRGGVLGRDRPRSGEPGPEEGAEDADTKVSLDKVDEDRRTGGLTGAGCFGFFGFSTGSAGLWSDGITLWETARVGRGDSITVPD